MVVYIFLIAIVNVAIGFALAVYLARCYRQLVADDRAETAYHPNEGCAVSAEVSDSTTEAKSADETDTPPPPETTDSVDVTKLDKIPDEEYATILDSLPGKS